jgi:hypothetical protein
MMISPTPTLRRCTSTWHSSFQRHTWNGDSSDANDDDLLFVPQMHRLLVQSNNSNTIDIILKRFMTFINNFARLGM